MGCVKLHILDELYKNSELKVSYINKELTLNNSVGNSYSMRVYAYCMNNPINRIDPEGKEPIILGGPALIRGVTQALASLINISDVQDVFVLSTSILEPITGVPASTFHIGVNDFGFFSIEFNPASSGDVEVAKMGAMVPAISGSAVKKASNVVDGIKVTKETAGQAGKTIAKENGVTVKSYGTNDAHKPAHAHVKGGGQEVRVGANGKPLKGQPELSTKQKNVIENNKKEIRKEVNKVGKENKKIEELNKQR